MRRTLLALLILGLNTLLPAWLTPGSAVAQSADAADRAAQQCEANGGTWDGSAGRCVTAQDACRTAGGSWTSPRSGAPNVCLCPGNQQTTPPAFCPGAGDRPHNRASCTATGGRWNESVQSCVGGRAAQAPSGPCDDSASFFLGFPTWYKYLELDANCEVVGPKNSDGKFDWPKAVGYVGLAAVEILLRIAALFAVGFVIYGGFRYITSQGDPENAKSARQTIVNSLVGLVIAIAAASIVAFIGNRLG